MGAIINVEGMTCSHCKAKVEKALEGCGIKGCVNIESKQVVIENGDVFIAQREITDAGYQVVGYKLVD